MRPKPAEPGSLPWWAHDFDRHCAPELDESLAALTPLGKAQSKRGSLFGDASKPKEGGRRGNKAIPVLCRNNPTYGKFCSFLVSFLHSAVDQAGALGREAAPVTQLPLRQRRNPTYMKSAFAHNGRELHGGSHKSFQPSLPRACSVIIHAPHACQLTISPHGPNTWKM